MNRIAERTRPRGIALIATLALIIFLSAMIAEVIRGNMAQRRYLKQRRAEIAALYLAESGVSEALCSIAQKKGLTTSATYGRGSFVQWSLEKGVTGVYEYEIRSEGVTGEEQLAFGRRSVKVRVLMPPDQPAKILSWIAAE